MVYFTDENHPELMNIPLKGNLLREFIEILKDSADLSRLQIANNDPDFLKILSIKQRIIGLLTQKIDKEGAIQHGLDAHDIAGIAYKATGVQAPDDASEVLTVATFQQDPSNPGVDGLKSSVDEVAAANSIMQSIMHVFSICLASQGGRQSELLTLCEKSFAVSKEQINHLQFNDSDKKLQAGINIGRNAALLLIAEQQLALLRARKSPVLGLMEQVVYGAEYSKTKQKRGLSELLDHTIEVLGVSIPSFGNLDSTTEVGRQNIRKGRSEVLREIRESLGLPSREID